MLYRLLKLKEKHHITPKASMGFSLVELVTVIAIIGILAGVATPMIMRWLPNMRLKIAARDLYSHMQNSRVMAVKTNTACAIVFEPATNSYHICTDPGPGNDWTDLGTNTIKETVSLPSYGSGIAFGHGSITGNNSAKGAAFPGDDVDYTAVDNVLTVSPGGTVSSGYVYLENENQDSRVYAIGSLVSGAIMIKEWKGGGKWD